MNWIPVFTSLTTGLVALAGIWITQKSQQNRWYADFFLKRKIDSISDFQVALHEYISALNNFDSSTIYSFRLEDSTREKYNLTSEEVMKKKLDFIETRLKEIKETHQNLLKSYYIASTYFTKKDEVTIDVTLNKLMPLAKSIPSLLEIKKYNEDSEVIMAIISIVNEKIKEARIGDTYELLREYLHPSNLRTFK